MKKKLLALILAGTMAFSLVGCEEDAKPTEVCSRDFEAGTQSVTIQDLTYRVPKAWIIRVGENGFTYYYPNTSTDSYLAVAFNETTSEDFRITEWENFNAYMSGMGSDDRYKNTSNEMRQNKNKIAYAHYTGEWDIDSDIYAVDTALFDCDGGFVSVAFMSKKNLSINYVQDVGSIFDSVEVPERPSSPSDDESGPEPTNSEQEEQPSPVPTKPSQEEPSAEPSKVVQDEPVETVTTGQRNALSRAKKYLSIMAFSHSGLIGQLEYDGYTTAEATYGADNCGADWNEQAAGKAQKYIEIMSFSRQRLIDQLKHDGFTQSQAEYGVSAVGY